MSKYIYSPSHNAFYLAVLKAEYELSGNWPEDGVEISDDLFIQYTSTPPDGKERGAGENGMPCWVDLPEPTTGELIAAAEQQKQTLLSDAQTMIAPLQDAYDLEMATDEETARLLALKKYRVLLNRIDTSSAPGIEWPTLPENQAS
ncbi:tail fiber assembly protein [Citrobacter koseri]|uniref:tail fiber assembly protein n=1 Tax=Citrobacter koseri TaxID=545 RepID=UPI001A2EFD41|nr:tail fiber assembly protein [Citrobacter koseri]EKW1006062.1 tail fiber assembly protein [Citrobacter koseri]HAT3724601.1 tail fiber assembly protein [Citrobacter koseri]HEM8507854.1 tail fiber assembly protein [Citrobacter koseri]HEM8574537.1 tail fiber assembly protein [Citrobacter koseri]